MTPRCAHCHSRLSIDEVSYYGHSCNSCEDWMMRRFHNLEAGRRGLPMSPRLIGKAAFVCVAFAIIAACIVGLARLGEW